MPEYEPLFDINLHNLNRLTRPDPRDPVNQIFGNIHSKNRIAWSDKICKSRLDNVCGSSNKQEPG